MWGAFDKQLSENNHQLLWTSFFFLRGQVLPVWVQAPAFTRGVCEYEPVLPVCAVQPVHGRVLRSDTGASLHGALWRLWWDSAVLLEFLLCLHVFMFVWIWPNSSRVCSTCSQQSRHRPSFDQQELAGHPATCRFCHGGPSLLQSKAHISSSTKEETRQLEEKAQKEASTSRKAESSCAVGWFAGFRLDRFRLLWPHLWQRRTIQQKQPCSKSVFLQKRYECLRNENEMKMCLLPLTSFLFVSFFAQWQINTTEWTCTRNVWTLSALLTHDPLPNTGWDANLRRHLIHQGQRGDRLSS